MAKIDIKEIDILAGIDSVSRKIKPARGDDFSKVFENEMRKLEDKEIVKSIEKKVEAFELSFHPNVVFEVDEKNKK